MVTLSIAILSIQEDTTVTDMKKILTISPFIVFLVLGYYLVCCFSYKKQQAEIKSLQQKTQIPSKMPIHKDYCILSIGLIPDKNNPPLYPQNIYWQDLTKTCNNPITTQKAVLMERIAEAALDTNLTFSYLSPQKAIQELKSDGDNAAKIDLTAERFYLNNNIAYPSDFTRPCRYPQIRSGIFCLYSDQIPK